jgi:branched-chain amino acid transport system ATP-binding protein
MTVSILIQLLVAGLSTGSIYALVALGLVLALSRRRMLELVGLRAGYNRTDVLRTVSISVPRGGFIGLLGPNGAGKTTLMRSISGFTRIYAGDILFEGRSLRGRMPEAIVDLGIIHVPQGRMLFPELTIEENLQLGAYRRGARAAYRKKPKIVEEYFPIL